MLPERALKTQALYQYAVIIIIMVYNNILREYWLLDFKWEWREKQEELYWSVSFQTHKTFLTSQVTLVIKNLPANAGDVKDQGSIPGLGRSTRGGNGYPLQHSCLENLWTEEPGGLRSIGLQRVQHNWSDTACMHYHWQREYGKQSTRNWKARTQQGKERRQSNKGEARWKGQKDVLGYNHHLITTLVS